MLVVALSRPVASCRFVRTREKYIQVGFAIRGELVAWSAKGQTRNALQDVFCPPYTSRQSALVIFVGQKSRHTRLENPRVPHANAVSSSFARQMKLLPQEKHVQARETSSFRKQVDFLEEGPNLGSMKITILPPSKRLSILE